ncbi:uncharacterized protein B0H18DRAFT_1121799 [Fomitopsis serialis]|uniref:uncharacterized protein n=1 Tax=Fomitopsis serialis TaxID=139415 RepID=UPI002007F019|nr:uncharacterized protein B0H18DRAFT_1121799 [Neoantrodia serialis]KAH9920707.1 hypothetical protein B0H18DRAFT_1121799 [Neoantrodia serialis]
MPSLSFNGDILLLSALYYPSDGLLERSVPVVTTFEGGRAWVDVERIMTRDFQIFSRTIAVRDGQNKLHRFTLFWQTRTHDRHPRALRINEPAKAVVPGHMFRGDLLIMRIGVRRPYTHLTDSAEKDFARAALRKFLITATRITEVRQTNNSDIRTILPGVGATNPCGTLAGCRLFAGDLRLSPTADSPPPEIDLQGQDDDHPRFTPRLWTLSPSMDSKHLTTYLPRRMRWRRRRFMRRYPTAARPSPPSRSGRPFGFDHALMTGWPLTTYHVPAAPNAMAKATPRAKISELQPTPRPPIRRPRLAPVLERLRGRRVTSYCVFIPVTVSSLHGPTAFSSTSISCIFVSLSHVGVGVHLHAFPYVYDGSAQPIMSDSSESVLPPAYADSQASAFEQSICPPPYGPRLLSRPSTVTSALSPIQSLRLASSLVDLAAPYDDDPTPDPIVPPNDACFWIRT